jgi:DNA-binding NarL/FixJ family response regulator
VASPIKVLLVDDHLLIRTGIKHTVEAGGLCTVVGEASNGREAVQKAAALPDIDLVLMDVGMPEMGGPEATAEILKLRPGLKIIALTMFQDQGTLAAMIGAGVVSYVPKSESPEELRRAITDSMEGRHYFPPGASAAIMSLIRTPSEFGGVRLTKREFEALRLTAAGRTVKETAKAMNCQMSTARGYRKSLGRKTGERGSAALRDFYFRHQGTP